jgi:hypothetical protein
VVIVVIAQYRPLPSAAFSTEEKGSGSGERR